MSLADEFGQWKQRQPVQQLPVEQVPQEPEKPFWERAKNDIVNTVSNYRWCCERCKRNGKGTGSIIFWSIAT